MLGTSRLVQPFLLKPLSQDMSTCKEVVQDEENDIKSQLHHCPQLSGLRVGHLPSLSPWSSCVK